MVDAAVEKKLMNDIFEKNTLRNEIEGYLETVSQWRDKLFTLKSFQEQTKYTDSIKRYVARIEGLRVELTQMNEEVDKNIREVGKFSDADVKAFSAQLEQDVNGILEADRESKQKVSSKKIKVKTKPAKSKGKSKANSKGAGKGVGSLQQKIEKVQGRVSEGLEEVERVTGKIITLNKCLKKVDGGAGATSEDLYTQELKRIVREKAIYG